MSAVKPTISEAQVLRRFALNIRYAAFLGTPASRPYRKAYIEAMRRARSLEARKP